MDLNFLLWSKKISSLGGLFLRFLKLSEEEEDENGGEWFELLSLSLGITILRDDGGSLCTSLSFSPLLSCFLDIVNLKGVDVGSFANWLLSPFRSRKAVGADVPGLSYSL